MPAYPAAAIVTQTPRYNVNGLVTDYGNIHPLTGSPVGRYEMPSQPNGTAKPIWGPNGVLIDSITGQPFTGTYNNTHIKNGVQLQLNPVTGEYGTPDSIAQSNAKIANDPNARYAAVNIPKNPDISDATSKLVSDFKQTADASLKDFSDYLSNFKGDVSAARDAGKAATDIGPTVSNLRQYQTNYGNSLDSATNQYRNALDAGQAQEQGIVKQAQDMLPQYDQAAQNVADRQQQAVMQQLSRYKLSSGTPTGLGSDELKILAQGVQDVQLPTQLAKINQGYNVLDRYALPVSRDITGQNAAYAGSFLPSVAGSRFGADTGTESTIQNLKTQVANMSFDDATRYMQSLGIPWALQSQILGGNVQNLSGLNALESGSRYQGLQDKLGVNVQQPQNFSFQAPTPPVYNNGYPSINRYSIAPGSTSTATTGGVPPVAANSNFDPAAYLGSLGLPGFPGRNLDQNIGQSGGSFYDDPAAISGNSGGYFS